MSEVKLRTSIEIFEEMHRLAEGKDQTARVSTEALKSLLADHSTLVKELQSRFVKIIEPKHRERL